MKKGILRIFSIYLSISVILTTILLPELFVFADGEIYNAQLISMAKHEKKNGSGYEYSFEAESSSLTPEINGFNMTINGWTAASTTNNTENYIYIATENSNDTEQTYSFHEEDAILFYVKTAVGTPENELFFQLVTSTKGNESVYGATQWMMVNIAADVHYLHKGDTQWTTVKAVQSNVASNRANIVIPSGFEGWIRVPFESFYSKEDFSTEICRLNFYLKNLGSKYSANDISFGSFMIVDNGNEDLTSVSYGGTQKSLLVELPCHNAHLLTPETVNGAEVTDNETAIAGGYSYKLSATQADFTVEDNTVADKSILSYIRLPLDGDSKASVKINGKSLKPNSEVLILNRGEFAFKSITVADDGTILLPSGFEGYILIPTVAYDSLEGQAVSKVAFEFDKTGAVIGSVLLSDNANGEVIVRMDYDKAPVDLLKDAYYNGTMLDTDDNAVSSIVDNNYYNVSDKVTDNEFSIGIDDGYYYELSAGDAPVGEYEIASNITPSYTGSAASGVNASRSPNNNTCPIEVSGSTDSFVISVNSAVETDGVYEATKANYTNIYANIAYNSAPTLLPTGSILFYVKHSGGTKAAKITVGQDWYLTFDNRDYYLLPSGTNVWQQKTTVTAANDVHGYLEIPADFEGWVRVPASTLVMGRANEYANVAGQPLKTRIFPGVIGGDYGNLVFSNFITVAESDKDYTNVKLGTDEMSLLPSNKPYTSTKANLTGGDYRPKPEGSKISPLSVVAENTSGSVTLSVDSAIETDGVYEANSSSYSNTYAIMNYSNAPTLSPNGSLMFYVKHSGGTKDVKITVSQDWYLSYNNREYYLLANNSDKWQSKTTTVAPNNVHGYITIPANFEGWVRIPSSAFVMGRSNEYASATAKALATYIFPSAIGGDYGSLTFSNFNVVSENENRVFFNYGDDVKVPLNSNITDFDTANYFKINMGTSLNQKVFKAEASVGDFYSEILLKNTTVLNTDNALMFYLRQNGITTSQLSVVLGDSGMRMITGAAYSVFDSQQQMWVEKTALDGGKIGVEGGFSGWVRIPYSSLTDANNLADPDGFEFGKILITPYQLGSTYGNIKIGSFIVVNHGDEQLVTMRVNKADEIPLTIREAYTAKTMVPSDVLGTGVNARNVVAQNINQTILEGGYLYSVSSTYETVSMDENSALEITVSGGLIEKEDGIIAYVRIPDGKDNAVILGGEFKTAANSKYYILNSGNESVWEEKTANNDGTMPIPAGFDGYIRIPFASMKNVPQGEITEFLFGFSKIGGDYGEPIFGTFMLSENTGYNFYDIYVDVIEYSQSLIQPDYYEGYVLQGEATVDGDDNIISITKAEDNSLTPDIPEGYAYKVTAVGSAVKLDAKTKTPRMSFTVDELYRSKLSSSGAVMFYVDISGCTENTLHIEAVGDITVTTQVGSRFGLLQNGNAYWEEHVSNGDGYLPLREGFSGWVRIPFTSLKDSKGVSLKESIKKFNFTFKNIGDSYGAPQIASIILLSNNGEFGKLMHSGYTDKINLYGAKQKTVYTRDDIAIWDSVIDPFVTYQVGEAASAKFDIDKTVEDEVNNTFSTKVVSGITPFPVKGIEYLSEKALDSHGDHYPRTSMPAPFSLKDSKGILMYLKVPDNGEEVNSVFIQMRTTGNKWVSVKKEFMIPVLQKGETDWENVFVQGQRIQFPAGFEGYVYLSHESMVTHTTGTGVNLALNENDVVSDVIIGVDRYGGSVGTVTLGGIFLSRNGILSHNGAYVDGDTVCRDVFLGTAVSEDTVRYSIYDAPSKAGAYLKDVPVPTAPEYIVDLDNITGHSVDVFFEAYPGANRYRIDVYKINAVSDSFTGTYYEYVSSKWTDSTTATVDSLVTGTSYTIVVSAFKDNTGLAIYALCPARPEGTVFGDMYITNDDPYKYDWITNDGVEYEWEYEEIYEDPQYESITKTERVKKVMRRRKAGGMETWLIIVIIAAAVVVLAAATVLIIILIKKKRRNSNEKNN